MANIIVTGCSRGVGLETCKILLQQGYTIYGVARTHTDNFKELENNYPNCAYFLALDLANAQNTYDTFKKYFKKIPIAGFVNNAALAYDDIVTNLNLDRLEGMFRVNVFTPMMIVKYVLRNMILFKQNGSIVHVSSISVQTGYKGLAMYAASKGALEAFSKNTAREWGLMGIRSNIVAPGFMATSMSASLTDEQRSKIYARTSLKAETSVISVAETIAFLLSEKSRSITGEVLHVDNGTI